jgi:hypothetical protein
MNVPVGSSVPFKKVISALLDNSKSFPAIYLHQFSDIQKDELEELSKIWLSITPERRSNLLGDLEELAEADTIVCFDDVAHLALGDPEAQVRMRAINMLWEAEDRLLVPIFLKMLEGDPGTEVRAAAASALGKFVYLGETEEVPGEIQQNIEDALLLVSTSNEPTLVRRHALEALGFSHREDVASLIEQAYKTGEREWLISALYAMGRSVDPKWEKQILPMLSHDDDEIRFEAVRAAGELELKSARQSILDGLEEGIEDYDLRMASIWSLSQIGGEGVRERIEDLLENCPEGEECEYLEEALDNLSFTEDFSLTNILDLDVDDEEENGSIDPESKD